MQAEMLDTLNGQSTGPRLTVLCYHAICADTRPLDDYCFMPARRFAEHMRWLKKSRLDVLPLDEAVSALRTGTLDRNAVVVTFDDGYRNNITHALPVLKDMGFHATVFLTTGLIGTASLLWPNRILKALEDTKRPGIDWRGLTLAWNGRADRVRANARLQQHVKDVLPGAPDMAASEIETCLDVAPDPLVEPASIFAMMSSDDIHAALQTGAMGFGAHTMGHPILSALDDAALEQEVAGSVEAVEKLTGQPCRSFAYPNGRPQDFDHRTIDILRKCGIVSALTTVSETSAAGADPLRLPRWTIGGGTSWRKLRARVWLSRLRRRARS